MDSLGESLRNVFVELTVSLVIDSEGADHTLWCPTPGETISSEDNVERLCKYNIHFFKSVFLKKAGLE